MKLFHGAAAGSDYMCVHMVCAVDYGQDMYCQEGGCVILILASGRTRAYKLIFSIENLPSRLHAARLYFTSLS